jgi:hypothetical protein
LLFVVYCLLFIVYFLFLIAHCSLPFAYCLFLIAYCLLPIAYCLLLIALLLADAFGAFPSTVPSTAAQDRRSGQRGI